MAGGDQSLRTGYSTWAVLPKIQSWSDDFANENAFRAAPRISASVPTEFGKFEPQAIRDAPNAPMTLAKNVSGVALPQLSVLTLIRVIFTTTRVAFAPPTNCSAAA